MARILIVDDNAPIRYLMRFYLEQAGYIVCGEAYDGVEAIECAKQTQPDLILLDFTMPIMSGMEAASVLKRMMPETPIILFTLHEDSINKELAATMGVDLVVDKAGGIPKLGESVRTLLNRAVKITRSSAAKAGNATQSSDDAGDARKPQ